MTKNDEAQKKAGAPDRKKGGPDYQSGVGGTRADVKNSEEEKEPQDRQRGASNRDDEDDGHS